MKTFEEFEAAYESLPDLTEEQIAALPEDELDRQAAIEFAYMRSGRGGPSRACWGRWNVAFTRIVEAFAPQDGPWLPGNLDRMEVALRAYYRRAEDACN